MLHITKWLTRLGDLQTSEGLNVEIWRLRHHQSQAILSAWAKHFREHYCSDSLIDVLRAGTGLERKEYLEQLVFPDQIAAPGPSIRSGDFAELLVADYLEFTLGYWVPRSRMESKAVRNESVKGCDVIGFKIVRDGTESATDELAIYESKALFSRFSESNRLQTAVDHSAKDNLRKAEALNFLKRRLVEKCDQMWQRVERFQNPVDKPYVEINGAAAILTTTIFDQTQINLPNTVCNNHPNHQRLKLLVIHGDDLMTFVNALYSRAADEA